MSAATQTQAGNMAAQIVANATAKYNAFAELAKKNSAVVSHKITPTVSTTSKGVTIEISFDQLQGCRPSKVTIDEKTGKEKGGGLGFMCEPIVFEYNGVDVALKPGWVSLQPVQK